MPCLGILHWSPYERFPIEQGDSVNSPSGFRRPQPGDTIGFNVAVGDDDNGGPSYLRTEPADHTDSFTAWDGRSIGWYVFAERDWGNLYLAPRDR
jgi:hypothetical protein